MENHKKPSDSKLVITGHEGETVTIIESRHIDIDDALQKHTPGPWEITEHEMYYVIGKGIVDDEGIPRNVATTVGKSRAAKANARLIAAAPKLLASLKAIIDLADTDEVHDHDMGGCDDCVLCDARKAIALAA